MITAINRAYCAGLFEGEGNIYSCTRTSYKKNKKPGALIRQIKLDIGMTDLLPLELFNDIVGVGTINGPYDNKYGYKLRYMWRTDRFEEVQFVICNIWDWLSPRRKEQIVKALTSYTSFKLTNHPMRLSKNRGNYR